MPASRTGTPAPRWGEFFRYHGWLAPGVRSFRVLGFRAKASWIAVAFMIPLLALLAYQWRTEQTQIDATQAEQAGLRYVASVLDVIKLAQARRGKAVSAPDEVAPLQDRMQAAFELVVKQHAELGERFTVEAHFSALLKAHKALLANPLADTPDATFEHHSSFIALALDLIGEVADGSQLTLDTGLDTHHMINLAVLRGPLQVENLARLRGQGAMVLRTQNMTPQRRDALMRASAALEVYDRDVENAYRKGIVRFPQVAKLFDMKGADASVAAFATEVQQRLLGPKLSGDVGAFWALGSSAIDKVTLLDQQVMQRLSSQLQARVDRLHVTQMAQMGLATFFIAVAGYLMLSFYKVMMGGLQEVSGHLQEITKGNLTTAPQPWGRDEAAQLMIDLRDMQVSLRQMVLRVRNSADEIVHTSSEIASGAMDLSGRTEQTAANLEESASSMEQISSTVKNTAEHTEAASHVARQNAEVAAAGGQAMRDVVHTMDGIRASSSRIGEIISVIDGIAFQTNILALNAAVEAARAGEAGRGFAVVASEVRSLAKRSADAASEIKVLISSSVDQVEAGTDAVRRAGATIDEFVGASQRVDKLLGEISTSAREQSMGVGQIGQAVNELDRMTQQNAALVEQTAAAAAAMKDQAGVLAEEVARFRLPEGLSVAQASTPDGLADFDFDKAIEAHRQWKVTLRKAISGHQKLDADTLCRDDQCPLGRWIHGPGGQLWGSKPRFVELTQRHADFHKAAGEVAHKINAAQFTDAERLIGSGSRFAQASTEVATLLTMAKRGL